MESHPGFDVQVFGNEAQPLVVIDKFSSAPEALLDAAAGQTFSPLGPHYPGIRAQANPSYLAHQAGLLETVLKTVFGITSGATLAECAFSIVTTPPEALTPIQRIPHFDSTDPNRIALLHYLGGRETGGTAFFRHRQTGFETIGSDRMADYDRALNTEAGQIPSAGYVSGSTALFEQTGHVEARFNRMVMYRGYRLHSGQVPRDLPLSGDPRTGRLTVNTFLQSR